MRQLAGQKPPEKTIAAEAIDAGPSAVDGPISGLVKVEANLLRFPLFALHTKGLKSLDAIECRGRLSGLDVAHEFTFRAYRSTATHYPGPLSRSVHLAFLSLLGERGLPAENPIRWTWRDLYRRMRVSCSGRTVERIKGAITATAGLYLISTHALYAKPAMKRISNREEGLHLYDRVCFLGSEMPGGGVADANYLWFSDWYLSNINALFTAPLNYELWRQLEVRSALASRLYEFLLLNFYNGAATLRINYANLVRFLPAKPERHASQAKQQLCPAFTLLEQNDVIGSVVWGESRDGQTQLVFERGRRLDPPAGRAPSLFEVMGADDEFASTVEVEELRSQKSPEWAAVVDFYRQWAGVEDRRPTAKELEQGRNLVEKYGATQLRALIPLAVKRMKTKWPDAKTFGSVTRYLDEAAGALKSDQRQAELERQGRRRLDRQREESEREAASRTRFEAEWAPLWGAAGEEERDEVRREVTVQHPWLARAPRMFESSCLEEFARRRGGPPGPD